MLPGEQLIFFFSVFLKFIFNWWIIALKYGGSTSGWVKLQARSLWTHLTKGGHRPFLVPLQPQEWLYSPLGLGTSMMQPSWGSWQARGPAPTWQSSSGSKTSPAWLPLATPSSRSYALVSLVMSLLSPQNRSKSSEIHLDTRRFPYVRFGLELRLFYRPWFINFCLWEIVRQISKGLPESSLCIYLLPSLLSLLTMDGASGQRNERQSQGTPIATGHGPLLQALHSSSARV